MDLERAQSSVSPVSPQPGTSTPTESSKHDHLIGEVEVAEGQLGPILRWVQGASRSSYDLYTLTTK